MICELYPGVEDPVRGSYTPMPFIMVLSVVFALYSLANCRLFDHISQSVFGGFKQYITGTADSVKPPSISHAGL